MIYWVIYDISDNNLRLKVSEECKNFGLKRIQKSAFCGFLSKNKAEMLAINCKEHIKSSDCIFIIPACKQCFSNKIILGDFNADVLKSHGFEIVG
ncbi:MAG: CRISPR-associated endonuclease Cas2 [Candidatus Diapherotrites archaeon]|nr:CRISPR-associated endonuclease Cas2 [Candidatus Diapherotrites archaeon]